MANVGGSSSGATKVPKVPERHEGHWGPSQMVEADFEIFYTKYHFPRVTHFHLPSANETPYTNGAKGQMCFFEAPLKSRILIRGGMIVTFIIFGDGWECFPSENHRSDSSMCRAFGSIPDHYRREITALTLSEQAHVDAILEAGSVDWNALDCSGDNPHRFGPISEVHTEILVPVVKEIHEIETPCFSILLPAPSVHGGSPSSPGASDLIATSMSNPLWASKVDCLEAGEEYRPTATSGFQHIVLLSISISSSGSNLLEIGAGL
ncbi:hypothetical protein CJ030_MR2G026835 [Morella rubra]|uniref:Uncharacterized protein n=1 Tax=Morella rubra TaxID=262757 RepID=A0A6A1WC28_9ROSI|nr:hypothetical protein CJ030_MR2G026835 [Morella rubra]